MTREIMTDTLPLVKGTLDVLVLKTLNLSPMHGFEVTTWLEERSGDQWLKYAKAVTGVLTREPRRA